MKLKSNLHSPKKSFQSTMLPAAPGLAIAVLPNNRQILSSGLDFQLSLWDIAKQSWEKSWDARGPIYSIRIIQPEGIALLSAVQGIVLWDLKEWDLCQENTMWSHSLIYETAYSEVTGEVIGAGEDTTIHRWNLHTREKIGQLPGHEITITALDISPSGRLAITGDLTGEIRIWDLSENTCIKIWKGHTKKVSGLQFTSNGRFALSGSEDGNLVLWELPSGKAVCRIEEDWITDIALGVDAREAYCCSRNGISHWALSDETLIARYPQANAVKFGLSPDGSVLAGLVRSNHMLIWEQTASKD